jgi:hypothetical protein
MNGKIRVHHLINGQVIIGEDIPGGSIRNPAQIVIHRIPSEDGKILNRAMFEAVISYGDGETISLSRVSIAYSYDAGAQIKFSYTEAVAEMVKRRSGLIIPKANDLKIVPIH